MISGKTTVIAHLGYPTFAFKAPMIYNPWFDKKGIDAVAFSADGQRVASTGLDDNVYVMGVDGKQQLAFVDSSVYRIVFTPDGKRLYVANAGSNSVSVVDVAARKELLQIPVGQVPKRNITAVLP